jgi:hypothetical protein
LEELFPGQGSPLRVVAGWQDDKHSNGLNALELISNSGRDGKRSVLVWVALEFQSGRDHPLSSFLFGLNLLRQFDNGSLLFHILPGRENRNKASHYLLKKTTLRPQVRAAPMCYRVAFWREGPPMRIVSINRKSLRLIPQAFIF